MTPAVAWAGLAAYFPVVRWERRSLAEALSSLLLDERWPWVPTWLSFSGKHKRDDRKRVRIGGKNGVARLLDGLEHPSLVSLCLDVSAKGDNFARLRMDIEREQATWGHEAAYPVLAVCRVSDVPTNKSAVAWLTWAHELVTTLGALNAVIGAWPSYEQAVCDTEAMRMVMDTSTGEVRLGLPSGLDEQIILLARWRKFLGRTYARHPRWGTYLSAAHLAAIGGVDRVRAEVAPAVITPLGELTYVQLTPEIETAMTLAAEEKRKALEALMAPILLGAPRPTPSSPTQ